MQRLHDTLAKLVPKGKTGGLGLSKGLTLTGVVNRDNSLPNNALYAHFVRAGSGLGQYHKRAFNENSDDSDNDENDKKEKK